MDLLAKKKKAAAIAVACYLQQKSEEEKTNPQDSWGKMGKNRIMEGRNFLQSKGKKPGNSIK